jgi:hypothetical protein
MNPARRAYGEITPIYVGDALLAGSLPLQYGHTEDYPYDPFDIENLPPDTTRVAGRDFRRVLRRTKRLLRKLVLVFIAFFTLTGLAFSGVFVAMQFHWLDVKGSSISRDSFFKTVPKTQVLAASVTKTSDPAVSCVRQLDNGGQVPVCAWNSSDEYGTIRDGLYKDKDVINQVAQQTGIPARMIAATVVPEQLRWFTDDRESFKKLFEPLKVLGVAAHMTYGIGGFHADTASRVEQYTADTNSPFYAGDGMATLVAYPSVENPKDNTTLARLSDHTDHYYSFLYVALFIKEITNQWSRAGYDISNRPDVIATLYNIGFDRSLPKANPQIGGANITVNGTHYNYGELGTDFYYSDELTSVFPMQY